MKKMENTLYAFHEMKKVENKLYEFQLRKQQVLEMVCKILNFMSVSAWPDG